jgi:hypothetical protein
VAVWTQKSLIANQQQPELSTSRAEITSHVDDYSGMPLADTCCGMLNSC